MFDSVDYKFIIQVQNYLPLKYLPRPRRKCYGGFYNGKSESLQELPLILEGYYAC